MRRAAAGRGRRGRRAGRRASADAARPPTTSAIRAANAREGDRVDRGLPRLDEERRRLSEQRSPAAERIGGRVTARGSTRTTAAARSTRRRRPARVRAADAARRPRRSGCRSARARLEDARDGEHDGDGSELEQRQSGGRAGGRTAAPPGCRSPSRASPVPGPPRIRMTPNDVKQKRNVRAAAAERAGASCGQRHFARATHRPGARARRRPRSPPGRSSPTHPPTMRVTTAMLKKTCAARIAQMPRS